MIASRGAIGSDLNKVDARENTADDYADIPELDDEFFQRAILHRDGVPRAEPTTVDDRPSETLSLTLDAEVVARFRAAGPGWRDRMGEVLRRAVGL